MFYPTAFGHPATVPKKQPKLNPRGSWRRLLGHIKPQEPPRQIKSRKNTQKGPKARFVDPPCANRCMHFRGFSQAR